MNVPNCCTEGPYNFMLLRAAYEYGLQFLLVLAIVVFKTAYFGKEVLSCSSLSDK